MVLHSIHVHVFYFQILNFDWRKNVTVFGVDNISTANGDNRKKDILLIDERPAQGLE